jgi:NAD(P) transhydrogenase
MEMDAPRRYDLCVIGSGPAGQRAAIQAAKLGRNVCIVERREVVGGVAINTGTIPSKALREAILAAIGRPAATPSEADFLAARQAGFMDLLTACHEVIKAEVNTLQLHLRRNGVEIVYGEATFIDPHAVHVSGVAGSRTIAADRFVIGVGTRPARPGHIPFDEQSIITSDELLRLSYLPSTMIVVGGGVIGTEYASMLQSLGVRVTLVEGRGRLLDFVDAEITEALQYHLRQAGMTLRLGENVVRIEPIAPPPGARTQQETMVQATLESGKTLRADCLLYCIGRQGATDALNPEAAGLTADDRGRIRVNENFQTEREHIYACGDVIGFPALASTSMEQGRLAALHMFGQPARSVSKLLPYGIYAIPEISMVGWTEEALTAEGIPYEAGIANYREIARGQLLGDHTGMLKMLIHQESHQILGVHAIGTGATELIHIGQTAIAFNATVEYFIDAVFNYPTLAECYKVAAMNGLNKIRSV